MRVWIKRIGYLILIPITLILLISILLYIPPFQNFAIRKATEFAGEATGMKFKIGQIRLNFPLNLTAKNLEVINTPADTLLKLEDLTIKIQALPLIHQQVLIEAINLQNANINTGSMIEGMTVKGNIGKFSLHADRIDLTKETATFNNIKLSDSAITLLLSDTTNQKDTISTTINWKLALNKIRIERVAFALQMPTDSLRISSFIDHAGIDNGIINLKDEQYNISHFSISKSSLAYDGNYAAPNDGLDISHIQLHDLNTSIDSICFQDRNIQLSINDFTTKERSGLTINNLLGRIRSDHNMIHISKFILQTPYSEANINVCIPWDILNEKSSQKMTSEFNASVGKEDLMIAAGHLTKDFKSSYPDQPININASINGNMSFLQCTHCNATLPNVFQINLNGQIASLADSIKRTGEITLAAQAGNLDFILSLLPASQRDLFTIPSGMQLKGSARLTNQTYQTQFLLSQDKGKVKFNAYYDPSRLAYKAIVQIDSLEPTHFMPKDSLYWLTASIKAEGKGADIFSPYTWAKVNGKISDIRYGSSSISDITLNSSFEKNNLQIDLLSKYPLAKMDISLNASIHKDDVKTMLIADVDQFDLYKMHLIPNPLSTSFQVFAEAQSDLKENNKIDVSLGNWEVSTPKQSFKPKMLTLHAQTNEDTTQLSFHAGDLGIVLTGNDCFHHISDKITQISNNITYQLKQDSTINLTGLRPLFPEMDLKMTVGQDNPIYNYLQTYYVDFKDMLLQAKISPKHGIQMNASLYELTRDTMLIDTIRAELHQDTLGLIYNAQVIKNKYMQQKPFSAGLDGRLCNAFANARIYLKNGQNKTGLLIGIQADKIQNGVQFHLFPNEPIIAFRTFKLNPDNYVTIRNFNDIKANLRLSGANNAAIWIHSNENDSITRSVSTELSQIDLGVISNAFTYLPSMKGILNADLQYTPTDSSFMVVADMNINNLFYENERVGEVMLNSVYLPLEQGNHQVDMHLFRDRQEIGTISALYQIADTDHINGNIEFIHFPLDIANPFIPEDMAKMKGDVDGTLAITGPSNLPQMNGHIILDTASIYIGAAGSTFKFDNKKIEINDNHLLFNDYSIYAYNKNPLLINGEIDFTDISRITTDFKLTANNLQLLNGEKTEESLVYGKLFANLNSSLKGPLDALTMRGDLQLLGGTNITYVLKDSPLTVQDRMSDMVTFTSFADSIRHKIPRKPPLPMGGMDMLMTIRIDPAVQANIDLSTDQSSHINLEGGGDLSFQYTPQGDMFLNGRYTLSGGTIKYAVPVIPLKEFNVQEGSYVQWTGNPMDPTLNLIATERVRTSVTPTGQSSPRMVNFDVGIELTQRLENLGLQFTLTSPEDLAMQEELTSKGPEERAKLAVSMLVTGMYLGSNNGGGKVNVNMGNALTSFLQNEINNIAGSALKTVDISFGMETYDDNGDAGGGSRTDYSFRFAKRFYNDRIRVVLGGRISTGENINNGQAQPFIDNVSVEYRLDNSGSRYVKLFHNKNYESLLEGEITETGAGIVLRKKMMRLRELFNFKKTKVKPIKEKEKKE